MTMTYGDATIMSAPTMTGAATIAARSAARGGDMLDPWLACTREGEDLVRPMFAGGTAQDQADQAERANIWFRRHADTNRDMRLTDPEIKAALVNHVRHASRRQGRSPDRRSRPPRVRARRWGA